MENYRKTIKLRIIALTLVTLFGSGVIVFDQFFADKLLKENDSYAFQIGALCAIVILGAIKLIKYKRIIDDTNKLKVEYNKETDERILAIRSKAGLPIILYTSIAMIIAGIIAGYFNVLVFKVLIIASVCQLVASIMVKAIYSKRI